MARTGAGWGASPAVEATTDALPTSVRSGPGGDPEHRRSLAGSAQHRPHGGPRDTQLPASTVLFGGSSSGARSATTAK